MGKDVSFNLVNLVNPVQENNAQIDGRGLCGIMSADGEDRKESTHMKKQVAHIGIGFAALAAFAALVLTGCVPGEAQIKVKSSELAKMANGKIPVET